MTEQVHHTTRRLHKELRPTHLLNAIKMMKAASPNWVDWVLNIRQSMGMESLSYDTLTRPDVIVAKTIFELKAKLKEINSEQQALNRLNKAVPALRKDFPHAHITDLIDNARKALQRDCRGIRRMARYAVPAGGTAQGVLREHASRQRHPPQHQSPTLVLDHIRRSHQNAFDIRHPRTRIPL